MKRAMDDPSDDEARGKMIMASTFAGIGFGNAGVTLPHAMSYPIAGMVREYIPEGYPKDHPLLPHGMAVILRLRQLSASWHRVTQRCSSTLRS